ncbi:MAG: bifunctional hydroxymethylpyrimidine kinase/phosphomethylpyrimidine kinase [Bacteroides sp.]|nr:bifunctional hydroxymethylpyrimidine kinase/phosphomethylpyrimidine kinase [Bacteroides sp.]
MKRYPIVLTIAGSDCIGGNGAQADIKTISALGAYAASVVTALTVGNTTGLKHLFPIPQETIRQQIEAVMEDLIPDIVKLGLLNDIETIRTVADCLRKYHPRYVVYDPVMLSPDGIRFMEIDNLNVIKKELLPFVNLVTLNRREAELLSEYPINSVKDMQEASRLFATKNKITVLIKSGDLFPNEVYDVLYTPADEEWIFKDTTLYTHNTHGASCTFSSAISTFLALGYDMHIAVSEARDFTRNAMLYGEDVYIGHGKGPVCQTFKPQPMKFITPTNQSS